MITIKKGDIFRCSWGYDQTNVDFYQVTRVISDKTIEVKPIQSRKVSDSTVMPEPDTFYGETLRRRPRHYENAVYINGECSFMLASLWNGEPCYETPAGYGH